MRESVRLRSRLRDVDAFGRGHKSEKLAGEVLKLCDRLRDETLPSVGVVIEVRLLLSGSARRMNPARLQDRKGQPSAFHFAEPKSTPGGR